MLRPRSIALSLPIVAAFFAAAAPPPQPLTSDRDKPHAEPALEKRQAPGTRVFIALPKSFQPSEEAAGFVNAQGDVVSVVVIPSPWDDMNAQFRRETIEQGGRVKVHEKAEVSGMPGFRIETAGGQSGGERYVLALAFGDAEKTVLVTASTADSAEPRLAAFRRALRSVEWRHDAAVDPFARLPFSLDVPARYRSIGPGGGVAAFTDRPEGEPEPESDGFIIMTARTFDGAEGARAEVVLEKLSQGGLLMFQDTPEPAAVEIDGVPGFEAQGRTHTELGTAIDRYSLAVFDGPLVYELTASAPAASGKIAELRAMARSMKLKAPQQKGAAR